MSMASWGGSLPWLRGWTGLVRGGAWLILVGVTGVLVRAEADRPSLPEGVMFHADLLYRRSEGREVRLDLYLPVAPPPRGGRPVVLAIHGGGWRGGSKAEYGPYVARLAQHGYAVAAIDYRLSRAGRQSWPANLEDVREAVRWLRRHSTHYGMDPNRIVALGASAGGHLAAMLGTDPDILSDHHSRGSSSRDARSQGSPPRIQGVIDFYGPSDLASLVSEAPLTATPIRLMLQGGETPSPERLKEASPISHISDDDPPMLLIHGTEDTHVPVEQSRIFAQALERAGVPHRLLLVEKARHGFTFSAGGRDLLPEVLAFLKSTVGGPVNASRPRAAIGGPHSNAPARLSHARANAIPEKRSGRDRS